MILLGLQVFVSRLDGRFEGGLTLLETLLGCLEFLLQNLVLLFQQKTLICFFNNIFQLRILLIQFIYFPAKFIHLFISLLDFLLQLTFHLSQLLKLLLQIVQFILLLV